MEIPDSTPAGEEVTIYVNPSNPKKYTVVPELPSQSCSTNSFVLQKVEFSNDRSHKVSGVVPDHIDRLPDEGTRLSVKPETGVFVDSSQENVAASAELVFFTEDGVFAHNVEWKE